MLLKCGSLDNILGLLFSGSLGNSVQQCSSPFCRGGIRYRKRPPAVREAFSEAFGVKNRLLRYGTDIRCAEHAPMVRLASRNDPSGEGIQNGTQKSTRNTLQNTLRKSTRKATFIYEIKDLS